MGRQRKQLGQVRPGGASAVGLYSPPAGVRATATCLVVANTTGSATTFGFYHDDDGATFDQSTALAHGTAIQANETVQFEGQYSGDNPAGWFGVASGVGSALTFTLYGYEET